MVELTPLPKPSHLCGVHYDPASRTMHVQFKDKAGNPGPIYRHTGVPEEHHTGLFAADSHGGYYHQHIRKYPSKKLDDD